MTILYKTTDLNWYTRSDTLWGEGVTNEIPKAERVDEPRLCSEDVLHAYESVEQALILHSIHTYDYGKELVVWEAVGDPVVAKWDKVGVFELTTTEIVPLPEWYTDRQTFGEVVGVLMSRLLAMLQRLIAGSGWTFTFVRADVRMLQEDLRDYNTSPRTMYSINELLQVYLPPTIAQITRYIPEFSSSDFIEIVREAIAEVTGESNG